MPTERVTRRIDALLDQVDQAVDALEWARVRKLCDGVLRLDPANEDALSFLDAAGRETGITLEPGSDGARGATASSQPPATSPTDLPASFANGRYEVKSLLGEGGKKKVYLAHDTTLDRDVAFGLIKAEGLDAESRQRITREAQAMARLGDHPNLMPIFDLGEENGQPGEPHTQYRSSRY